SGSVHRSKLWWGHNRCKIKGGNGLGGISQALKYYWAPQAGLRPIYLNGIEIAFRIPQVNLLFHKNLKKASVDVTFAAFPLQYLQRFRKRFSLLVGPVFRGESLKDIRDSNDSSLYRDLFFL